MMISLTSAQQYGNTDDWKLAQEGAGNFKEERYELKRKLYRAVANVNILEGIRFYVSFACSLHLVNSNSWKDLQRLFL
jgi:ribonucleotide reductase beta subunit family protein with ferritin-like domain